MPIDQSEGESQALAQVFWDKLVDDCAGAETAIRMLGALFQRKPELLTEVLLQNPNAMTKACQLADERTLADWIYVGHIFPHIRWMRLRRRDPKPSCDSNVVVAISIVEHQSSMVEHQFLGTSYTAALLPWAPQDSPPKSPKFVGPHGELQEEPYHFRKEYEAKAAVARALEKDNHGWIVKDNHGWIVPS